MANEEYLYQNYYHSPFGDLFMGCYKQHIVYLQWANKEDLNLQINKIVRTLETEIKPGETEEMKEAKKQLDLYFKGSLKKFDLPILYTGTTFQNDVWKALHRLLYSQTESYLQLAKALGSPESVRAVASAVAENPIQIIIPCHRIIGSDGKLSGYAGGIEAKEGLLNLEKESTDVQMKLF